MFQLSGIYCFLPITYVHTCVAICNQTIIFLIKFFLCWSLKCGVKKTYRYNVLVDINHANYYNLDVNLNLKLIIVYSRPVITTQSNYDMVLLLCAKNLQNHFCYLVYLQCFILEILKLPLQTYQDPGVLCSPAIKLIIKGELTIFFLCVYIKYC